MYLRTGTKIVLHLVYDVNQVTNHMVGGEGGILKPALGESWKSIPHVRLQLTRDQGSNLCNVSILKHTFMVISNF